MRATIIWMMIVANWKAYIENPTKAKALVASANRLLSKTDHSIVIAPPAPLLGLFAGKGVSRTRSVSFAAQDISDSTGGAATGEITAALLSNMGVEYAIIGHSERRAMGETNELVTSKVQHALAHGIKPIVCIGERERDSEAAYLQFLRTQIESIFAPLSPKERINVVLAYEPIWAIGKTSTESITQQDLGEMILYIRKVLSSCFDGRGVEYMQILYGGSVEAGNIRDLAAGGGVDGFLIGHASADITSFSSLVKAVS